MPTIRHLLFVCIAAANSSRAPAQCQLEKLLEEGTTAGQAYGISVAAGGDWVAAGRIGNPGTVFFYTPVDGTWANASTFASSGGGVGWSIDIAIDRAIAGAPVDPAGAPYGGAAHYLELVNGQWVEVDKVWPSAAAYNKHFGHFVAIDGDTAANGASPKSDVYIFHRQPDATWRLVGKLHPEDPGGGKSMSEGNSLAIAGNICIAGVFNDDDFGEKSGSAYIFAVGPDADGDGLMDACECPGDINQDWVVNQSDLGLLLHAFGACPGDAGYHAAAGMLDSGGGPGGDPCVDQSDLGVLLAHYAAVCP